MRTGRPRIIIDWDLVEKYAQAGSSAAVIARKFRINPRSFYAIIKRDKKMEASEYMHQKHEEGVAEIELLAFEDAKKNPVARMFWLKCKGHWVENNPIGVNKSPALIQINIGGGADVKEIKMIEDIFNGRAILDTGLPKELGSIPEGQQADNK